MKSQDELIQIVSGNVKQMRMDRNLTCCGLAQKSGLTQRLIYKIESGVNLPQLWALYQVACALDVTIDQLLDAATAKAGRRTVISRGKRISAGIFV